MTSSDFWNRLTLGLTPVSESVKWQALESLAAELYPSGPDDHGLWERAGGNDADLPSTGSGRMRWRQGIRYMRQGKPPAPAVLLADMMEDYPHNERLVHLARDAVFQGEVEKLEGKGMNGTSSRPLTTKSGFTVGRAVVIGIANYRKAPFGYQMRLRMTPEMSRRF